MAMGIMVPLACFGELLLTMGAHMLYNFVQVPANALIAAVFSSLFGFLVDCGCRGVCAIVRWIDLGCCLPLDVGSLSNCRLRGTVLLSSFSLSVSLVAFVLLPVASCAAALLPAGGRPGRRQRRCFAARAECRRSHVHGTNDSLNVVFVVLCRFALLVAYCRLPSSLLCPCYLCNATRCRIFPSRLTVLAARASQPLLDRAHLDF